MDLYARRSRHEAQLAALGQEHVLRFWDDLNDAQRSALLDDLDLVDIGQAVSAVREHLKGTAAAGVDFDKLAPAEYWPATPNQTTQPLYDAAERLGERLLAEGKVAALTVAGGQGTRLGYDGPKGAFKVSPVREKPLFQLFAESILSAVRRYGRSIGWYIMTSPANDAATRAFFKSHSYFGLEPSDVVFFQQGVMPAFDLQGRLLLSERHRLALSPDGHGGTLLALARSGALADMADRGVEHLSYFQVDNPLVYVLDRLFIGLHAQSGSEMSSKCLAKRDDLERVGNFALYEGRLVVIEYSDLPESLAHAKNPCGARRFDAGSPAIHVISRRFIERLTGSARFGLPWHRANKKVPCVDERGHIYAPSQPNGIKLESFIFDALPLAEKPLILQFERGEQFSPVKNAQGEDSPGTCQRDMVRRAARWLDKAGVAVPMRADGEPDALIEISPLLATDAAELARNLARPTPIKRGAMVYLE